MVARMGGAALTINQITNTAAIARQYLLCQAGAGYTITATITMPNNVALLLIGYTTTRTDNGTVNIIVLQIVFL